MMSLKNLTIVSALAVASVANMGAASVVDLTADALPLVNEKRTKDLGELALETVASDTDGIAALQTAVTSIVTADCDISGVEVDTGYSRAVVELGEDTTAAYVVDTIFAEINNYNCVYPPVSGSLKGEVSNFTYMMAESTTGMACKKTSGCSANPDLAVCYFSPDFDGDSGSPFADKETFDAIAVRDEVCSGSYFAQYSGIFLSIAALSIGSGYILA